MTLVLQILRQIIRKWYLLVLLPICTASLVYFITSKSSKRYKSEAALYLNLPTNKGLSITNEEFKQHEISTYIHDLIQLAYSRKSIEFVKLSILKDYLEGKNQLLNTPKESFPWTDSLFVIKRIDSLITDNKMLDLTHQLDAKITIYLRDQGFTNEAINQLFKLYREGSSNYLRLEVTSSDPFISAYIGEKLIEGLLRFNKDVNQDKLEADQRLFEKLVNQAKKDLDIKVKNLERYKIRNNVINLPEHTKAIVNQMVQLEVQKAELIELLASKQEGILQLKTKLSVQKEIPVDLSKNATFIELQKRIRERNTKADNEIIQDKTLNEIQNAYQEVGNLVQEYVTDVPIDIRRTRQELIQQFLNFQVELEMTKQIIPLVEAEIKRISVYARTFAPLESNIGTLEREITTAQETFLILVNKLNLAKTVAQGTGVNELVVIDSPNVPLLPLSSKRKLLVLLSAILCFIFILILIGVFEFLDSGIWSKNHFKKAFGETPYSVLPNLDEDESINDKTFSLFLDTLYREKIKSIVIKLTDYLTDKKCKEIVILSSLKGEGKKRISLDIVDEFAQNGILVSPVIIDENGDKSPLTEINPDSADITLYIMPPTVVYSEWEKYLAKKVVFLWVYYAGRAPIEIDHHVLSNIENHSHLCVLNQVLPDYLEESGSFLAKKRSWIRILIKRILTLQFKAKNLEIA